MKREVALDRLALVLSAVGLMALTGVVFLAFRGDDARILTIVLLAGFAIFSVVNAVSDRRLRKSLALGRNRVLYGAVQIAALCIMYPLCLWIQSAMASPVTYMIGAFVSVAVLASFAYDLLSRKGLSR